MSNETKAPGGLQSMVPVLMAAAVAAMLGLSGMVDSWKADRGLVGGAGLQKGAAATLADAGTAVPASGGASDASVVLASMPEAERTRIEAVVRDYLLKNPEILFEAQQAFEAKMETKRQAQMTEALISNKEAIFRSQKAPTIGGPDADVTVVEFFDYNCGYCRRAIGDVSKLIETDKKVRFVFKEFPIFGRDSEAAARIAIAAKAQGKYWEVHRGLFEHEGKLNETSALEVAGKAGLDLAKLKADMTSPETEKEIADVRALAEKMGIQGTPHFFVGDRIIPGAPEDLYDQLTAHIVDVRKNGCSVC